MVRILCETMNKVKIVILLLFALFAACSEDKPLNHGLSFGYYNDWAKVAIGEEREAMIRFGSPDVDCDTPRLAFYLHGPLDTLVLLGLTVVARVWSRRWSTVCCVWIICRWRREWGRWKKSLTSMATGFIIGGLRRRMSWSRTSITCGC